MNRDAMPRLKSFVSLMLASAFMLPLAACEIGRSEPAGPPPLEGARLGGNFELVGGGGETVRWTDFDGKYRIVYFGFTNCPDICPTDVQRTMQGFKAFSESEPELADQVQPIFITVDPARDTPAKVQEFASAFSDKLIGLTGTQDQIDEALKNFGGVAQLDDPGAGGSYDVQHSRYTYLFGKNGEPIAFLPSDEGAEAVAAELAKWVS